MEPKSLKTSTLCRFVNGADRKISNGVCFARVEFGNKPFSFRRGDEVAAATSSVINSSLMAVDKRDCKARMKASRRWVKEVDRVGTEMVSEVT